MDRDELTRRINRAWGRTSARPATPATPATPAPERTVLQDRAHTRNRLFPARYARARGVALRRGWAWTLTLEAWAALVALPCAYCGGPLEPTGSGLDRADNAAGYTPENSRPCCAACNSIKGSVLSEACMRELSARLRRWRRQGRIKPRRLPGRPVGSLKPGARFPCGKLRP